MRRATTPIHSFTFPDDVLVGDVTEALITYSQNGNTILEKTLTDLTPNIDNNVFRLALTEDETRLFAPGKALIQVRVKIGDGALCSQMIWLTVKPTLNSEDL